MKPSSVFLQRETPVGAVIPGPVPEQGGAPGTARGMLREGAGIRGGAAPKGSAQGVPGGR